MSEESPRADITLIDNSQSGVDPLNTLLTPFPDDKLDALQAAKPTSTFDTVAFWRIEEELLVWVTKPVHDQVFNPCWS